MFFFVFYTAISSAELDDCDEPSKLSQKDKVQTSGPLALPKWDEPILEKFIVSAADYSMATYTLDNSLKTLTPLELITGIIIGFLGPDLASGIFHALGDELTNDELEIEATKRSCLSRIFSEAKKNLFRNAHMHHDHPWLITEMSWYEKVRGYHILWPPILLTSIFYLGDWNAFTITVWGVFFVNTEVFHTLVHDTKKSNPLVEWAKENGLILTKNHHNLHHNGNRENGTPRFKYNFCAINGFMDFLLNPLADFFRRWCGSRAQQ